MDSVRGILQGAVAKRTSGTDLTELEKIVLWKMGEDIPECARWSEAFREFKAIQSYTGMQDPEPLSGGMYCWDLHSPEEYKCIAMGEGGYGVLVNTLTGAAKSLHMDDLTTRSPFGRYELLGKVATGSTIYYNIVAIHSTPCWTAHQIVSSDETNIVLRNSRGGSVILPTDGHKNKIVSYVPPVWSSFFEGKVEWRLDPFTHALFLDYGRYLGGGTLKCRVDVDRAVESVKLPGLSAAWLFLKTSPEFVFKVPGYEYSVWTSQETWAPSYCWTRARAIPENAIPSVWTHGCALLRAFHGPLIRTGWYITPWGIRFTNSNVKIDFGSSFVFNVPRLEIQFTLCTLKFDTAEAVQTFSDAYVQLSIEYTRSVPEQRTQIQELCAAAGGGM